MKHPITTPRHLLATAIKACRRAVVTIMVMVTMLTASCEREPMLYLHGDGNDVNLDIPIVELELQVFWDYTLDFGMDYDWRKEWYYGWDERDKEVFGELGYTKPDNFHLRRYHTGDSARAPHTNVQKHTIKGYTFSSQFDFGYWDLLAWNDIETIDGIQSLVFDEETTLDSVWAWTNQTMHPSRYQAPRFTRSFYQPEQLFSGYDQAEYISPDYEGFTYDEDRKMWIKTANMWLYPTTYIYLTQVILHNNRGRVDNVDGIANLSGMARTVNLNTGVAGADAITTHYNVLFKEDCDMNGEAVDIIGGRLLSFGMCNVNGSRVDARGKTKGATNYTNGAVVGTTPNGMPLYAKDNEILVDDGKHHYMDVTMVFNNGLDSTFVFDVTDQVRKRYKGGVLTVELDMDTVSIPTRGGGSGFDAVVKDFEEADIPEFEM